MADKLVFTEQQVTRLNEYLDSEFYDDWDSLDYFGREQINTRLPQAKNILWRIDTRYGALFPLGVDRVERIRDNLLTAFDLLLRDKRSPDPDQFYYLMELYELAIDSADVKLREAEAIPIVTLMMGAASVRTLGLAVQFARLQKLKIILDDLEREAFALKIEAQIQQALSFVVNTVTLITPGLSIVTKTALGLGDFLLDGQLGPNKTGIAGQVDDPIKVFNFVVDTLESIKHTSDMTKTFARKGGKLLTVTGFYIDKLEVDQADDFLKKVQKAMKEAKELSTSLQSDLATEINRVNKLAKLFKTRLAPLRREMADAEFAYYEAMHQNENPESRNFPWRFQSAKAGSR